MAKRTEEHVLDKRGILFLEYTLPAEWIVRRQKEEDYGWDFEVQPSPIGKVPGFFFKVQLKSVSKVDIIDDCIVFDMKIGHALQYLDTPVPVIFIIYDDRRKMAWWLFVQKYLWDILDVKNPAWRNNDKYVRLHIPLENVLETSINDLERISKEGPRYLSVKLIGHVPWQGILKPDFMPKDIIPIKEHLAKYRNESIEMLLHLGIIEIKEDKLEDSKKYFQEAYEEATRNNNDIGKAQSIVGIIHFLNPMHNDDAKKKYDLIQEGLKLTDNGKERIIHAYFKACLAETLHIHLIRKSSDLMLITLTNEQFGVGWMNYFVKQDIDYINTEIVRINKLYSEAITTALTLKNPYLFIEISIIITKVLGVFHSNYRIFYDEEHLKSTVYQIENILDTALDVAKALKNKETIAKVLGESCTSHWLRGNKEKTIEYGNSAVALAKEINDKKMIKDIEIFIEKAKKDDLPPRTKEEAEKRVPQDKTPIEKWRELVDILIKKHGIDLEKDDMISDVVRIGLKDFDPSRVLISCKNIEVLIHSYGVPGQMLNLPTAGSKIVFCEYGGGLGGMNLDNIFQKFKDSHCMNCPYRESREKDWKWDGGWKLWNKRVKELKESHKMKHDSESNKRSNSDKLKQEPESGKSEQSE